MIVVCTSCNAKFRVADEKIGPRGVRIRCSKCQGVFEVHPPPASAAQPPPPEVPPARSPLELDLDDSGRRRTVVPLAPPPVPAPAPSQDPFAGFGSSFPPPPNDPFAAAIASPRPNPVPPDDPFLSSSPQPSPPSSDPFLGASLATPEEPRPPPDSEPDPFAGAELGSSSAAPQPSPDFSFSGALDLPEGERDAPPPLPKRQLEEQDDGFSLDVDVASPAAPAPPPQAEPPATRAPVPPVESPLEEGRVGAVVTGRSGWLRALVVNSMSVAVLLGLALGLLMFWRGEGRGPRILRSSQLVGGDGLAATRVSSGLYPGADGRLLLFIRGQLRVGSASALGSIRVRADLMKGETVVATSECTAGAVPTPEELAAISSGEAAERLRAQLEPRAPKQAKPGEVLPFLMVFVDYPRELEGITYRVTAGATATAWGPPGARP